MAPLKRSASFKISVDSVEIEPVITYTNPVQPTIQEEEEQQNGHHNGVETVNGHNVGNGAVNGSNGDTGALVEEDPEPPVNILAGADWESVNYSVSKIECEDEVTGLAVSPDYIVAQFFLEPEIHVFSRKSQELVHRLTGHDYGGQAVQILDNILYSGSKDCTVRSWNLATGQCVQKVQDHRDYVQCLCVRKVSLAGLGEEGCYLASGGAADHLVNVYSTDNTGTLKKRFGLSGKHTGWITCVEIADNIIISGSKDSTINIWDLASGDLLSSTVQDAEITCLSLFKLKPSYLMFGDGESKLSLLDLASGDTIHLMPNTIIGTGKYLRGSKYHDKSVDSLHICDNSYMITASSGSKFIKVWKVEKYEDDIMKTDVCELQILRDHSDYLNTLRVEGNTIVSSSGDCFIYLHEFPEGQQHYDMLRNYERNSVAALFQGNKGLAPPCEKSAILCEGRLCKAGKTGLARSSSSFQVSFALKPTVACAEGRILLPNTIHEDSEEEDSEEFIIEYVTDSDEDGEEEW